MRMAELSRRSGVSVPTIKYYLREGLLPAGAVTSPNQADYGNGHLRRLRLIRALIDVGGLSVAAAREVLGAVDDPSVVGHDLLGVAHCAVVPTKRAGRDTEEWLAARAQRGDPDDEMGRQALMVEAVVTGTVLGESLLTGLRLLAQEAASARIFGQTAPSVG
jgi:DNA-binding transcriptional MerR regulator